MLFSCPFKIRLPLHKARLSTHNVFHSADLLPAAGMSPSPICYRSQRPAQRPLFAIWIYYFFFPPGKMNWNERSGISFTWLKIITKKRKKKKKGEKSKPFSAVQVKENGYREKDACALSSVLTLMILQKTIINLGRYQAAVQHHSPLPHPQCMGPNPMGRHLLAADISKKSKYKGLPTDTEQNNRQQKWRQDNIHPPSSR